MDAYKQFPLVTKKSLKIFVNKGAVLLNLSH